MDADYYYPLGDDNYTNDTWAGSPDAPAHDDDDDRLLRNLDMYITGVVVPSLGVVGVLGNLLNVAVLSCRYFRRDDDTMEKVALTGLISLALSDLCFCITILPNFCTWRGRYLFESRGFVSLYRTYGHYLNDVFIKISTWLTMIVATARYIAICHPLRARLCYGLRPTRVAVGATVVFWFLFLIPQALQLHTYPIPSGHNTTMYLLDTTIVGRNKVANETLTCLWAIFGYFIPVSVLAYCNVCLIRALRDSQLLRQTAARVPTSSTTALHSRADHFGGSTPCRAFHNRAEHSASRSSLRITWTLIVLVAMFIILVSPSEIAHFYMDVKSDSLPTLTITIIVVNCLQAINFSLTFILYCVVNVTFRRAIVSLLYYVVYVCRNRSTNLNAVRRQESVSHRSTLLPSQLRSHETNI